MDIHALVVVEDYAKWYRISVPRLEIAGMENYVELNCLAFLREF